MMKRSLGLSMGSITMVLWNLLRALWSLALAIGWDLLPGYLNPWCSQWAAGEGALLSRGQQVVY